MATIYYRIDRKRWVVQTTIKGERKQVGSFKSKKKALEAVEWLNSTLNSYKADFIEVDEPRIVKFVKSLWRKKK